MKTFLKILLGFVVFVAVALAAVFYFTRGLVDIADDFFLAIAENRPEAAYALTSQAFQSSSTQEELLGYLASANLTETTQTNWNSRYISGAQGEIKGTVETVSNGTVPVSLVFVKDKGEWKILKIDAVIPSMGAASPPTPSASAIPTEREQVQLVRETTTAFADSVRAQNMEPLYAHISELWRSQTSPDELSGIFGGFYQVGERISILETSAPQFDGPASLDENNILQISGRFVTGPDTTVFSHKYIYEGLGWKLYGLNLRVIPTEPAGAQPAPQQSDPG